MTSSYFQNKIYKPSINTETTTVQIQSKPTNNSVTEKLLFENLDVDSMAEANHKFFNFNSNDHSNKFNDFLFLTALEEDMRSASIRNEEGL